MTDDEIMRATVLDRALADFNSDRAKHEAELATLLLRYPPQSLRVLDVYERIAIIDRALADRRDQIRLLGQTGALTDTSGENAEASQAEIAALLEKITSQLAAARAEARELNSKRAELAALEQEAKDVRKLLEETSGALEMIRLEAGRALPGYTAILSPATDAIEPVEDSSKMLAAAGLGVGGILPLVLALIIGLTSGRVRHSDALIRFSHRVPVLRVTPRKTPAPSEADRLRNALQLQPLRQPHPPTQTRIITFTSLDGPAPREAALNLAHSFAQSGTRVLLIDADLAESGLSRNLDLTQTPGWRDVLQGQTADPVVLTDNLSVLPAGQDPRQTDTGTGIGAIRKALARISDGQDLVLICAPGPGTSAMAELLLSASDLGLAEIRPNHRKAAVAAHILRLDTLPRQGGGVVFTHAHAGDPGLPA
jgi:hypothetical protein